MSTDLGSSGAVAVDRRSADAVDVSANDTEPPPRRLVLVVGSGRSGTSTIAGILKQFGVHVPQPEVPADVTNPRGFAEPQWLVDFHDDLLARVNVHVSDARPEAWFKAGKVQLDEDVRNAAVAWLEEQFRDADEILLKDPRLIWFLGLWQGAALRVGAQVVVITMLRPPTEVVGSKRTYYGHRSATDNLVGWLNLMLHTERATRGAPRYFVQYQHLLDDWTTEIAGIGSAFGLAAIRDANAARINSAHQFVDPRLRRVAHGWDDLDVAEPVRDLATEVWELLVKLSEGDAPEIRSRIDLLRQSYAELYADAEDVAHSSVDAVMSRNQRLVERRKQVATQRDEVKATNRELRAANKALRSRLREQEQAIAALETQVAGGLRREVARRLPDQAKRTVKRMLGHDSEGTAGA